MGMGQHESVFLGIFQCLVGGDEYSATIIWHHQRTTTGRLDLLLKLARQQIKDQSLIDDLSKLMERFRSLSKWRNFYCHATYHVNSKREIQSAQGITLAQDGEPIRLESKVFDRATANEMTQAILDLNDFNREIWAFVERVEGALKVQRVKRPQLLDEMMAQDGHPPKDDPPAQ